MAVKVAKGQICNGTISKNKCHQEYYLCRKFHAFMKKRTIFGFCHYTKITLCDMNDITQDYVQYHTDSKRNQKATSLWIVVSCAKTLTV